MATTLTYAGLTITNVNIDRIVSTEEPGGDVAQRAATLTVMEGTGIVSTLADTSTNGVRRKIDDVRRILTTPGGRLTITLDGLTILDHTSADFPASGATNDAMYGPRMSANIAEVSGARCLFVQWRAEYRLWNNVTLNPIVGFVCNIKYDIDRNGYTTITRTGVLTVRRSASFPLRDGASGEQTIAPTVIAFAPTSAPFGGGQTPAAAGINTTGFGNNPDLYRRFVCGPVFSGFIRENQSYYIDESMQRLLFVVTDRQIAERMPNSITEANVSFTYEMNLQGGPNVLNKTFKAELWAFPGVLKEDILLTAVLMSKNRINWNSDAVAGDIIVRMSISEPDILNRNGLTFEVTAIGTNVGFAFTPIAPTDIFKSIMTGLELIQGPSTPDAYGTRGLVTLQDFVYEAAPPSGTHQSANTTGKSIMGVTAVRPVIAQSVPDQLLGSVMQEAGLGPGGTTGIPPGTDAALASEAPPGYMRVEGSMRIETDNSIVIGHSAQIGGADRVYQFAPPTVRVYEQIVVNRMNETPGPNVIFTNLPWAHVEIARVPASVSPVRLDANGNRYFTAVYERVCQILASSFTNETLPGGGPALAFRPATVPQPFNPQVQQPVPGTYPVPPTGPGAIA